MATTTRSQSKPPGPKGKWIKGNLPEFAAGRLEAITRWSQTYGDVVSARLGPRPIWMLNHPDLVEDVLVTQNKSMNKHFALKMTGDTLGNGLLTSEGDFWRRQRRMAQPAFHKERIKAHAAVMVDYAERMMEGWSDGQARDAQNDMMTLTLEIVAKTLFDADVSEESHEASHAMEVGLAAFTRRVSGLVQIPAWLPTPANRQLKKALATLDGIIYRMIAERRASGEERGDLLSMLLHAKDEDDGRGMTDRQLRDEAMTLFMAGHETTANTLGWAWFLLSRHPEVEARLHAELDEVLGDRPPTLDDLPRLTYTDHVITETLRLYPTVWLLGREAMEPIEVGGYKVPVGTTLYMSQWVIHRDPRFFDEPLSYKPERWEGGLARRIHRYAYFPFGGGPRICIGNSFATMEAVLLLATIARRYRLTMPTRADVEMLPTMTLRAKGGIPVTLRKRP
jgi:cytochrome P450